MGRVVVAGGAGFLGSHLCTALVARGDEVVCVDNLVTGSRQNVAHLDGDRAFTFVEADVSDGLQIGGPVDLVLNFASPASPRDYMALPIETLRVGSLGTEHALQLARDKGARFLLASTSEVYGDPEVHPQPESYWGHVNPVGPRSCYDEAKRYAEAITMAYRRAHDVDTRILRIFNVYGPRMRPQDGRVVSNFIVQALRGEPLTIYGEGRQTRSFSYVDDSIAGFLALADSDVAEPCNIGNDTEFTIAELAEIVLEVTGAASEVVHEPLPEDDPKQRRPDLTLARTRLGWSPTTPLRVGIERTVAWFAEHLDAA